jgi:hypothetical protein
MRSSQQHEIFGHWNTKAVVINGKPVTPVQFVRDLQADEKEPGDNSDIVQECESVDYFSWGDTSQATYCLALACCFYLNVKLVMSFTFVPKLQAQPQTDLHLSYTDQQLDEEYLISEELFAKDFKGFMQELGAREIPPNED